ncbi:hypothetical protein SAMN05444287_1444 [Octadecabacter temperatus]|uniref:Uncharacterized protein n=1 Tax=Octadecabacter temperatus TaxID=1458307 RepID=A0A0K0Y667_9RHOB|nr:hypothetical protein [Octadecabacter temperatus]AKS46332.1 hypothetical protein OSB_17870 [Octadecabacter temperatus]SIO12052.1 hypothetical protein SAMN05444287_1444 [Octadecabacter temperatus]
MKTIFLSALSMGFATSAFAGAPVSTPTASSGGADGAVILLLLVGAVLLINGVNQSSDRAKAPEADADDDDDLIMRF